MMVVPHVSGYDRLEKLGTGSFSTVYKAFSKLSKEVVAIKVVAKCYQKKSFADNAVKEISLLKLLKHKYIVTLVDFMWDGKHIFIITEYCDGGDLSHFIRRKHKLAEPLVKTFMQQLALALQFLNNHNVCHMDLKPQNLLLSSKPKLTLKLADFGLSQIISADSVEQSRFAGSLLYMAPEKLLNQQFDARVDLWSVGIIMYECLFGHPPFANISAKAILEVMSKKHPIELPKNAHVSGTCEDLVRGLLKYDPNDRISFQAFFEHTFLDLIHLPTHENYLTAVNVIHQAVALDHAKQYSKSLPLYEKAVQYLEAFMPFERDASKITLLNVRLNEYKCWIDVLKDLNNGKITAPIVSCVPLPLTENQYEALCKLSVVTPLMATGLDIGNTGESYCVEGKLDLALEKLTTALSMLIPMLQKEPPGIRRDMLHAQVQKWLEMAELLKKSD